MLLADRRRLPEAEARGVGVQLAHALARLHRGGAVHGRLSAAGVEFTEDGTLRIVDTDGDKGTGTDTGTDIDTDINSTTRRDAASARAASDVIALAVLVTECATGMTIDGAATWDESSLIRLGCPAELAADLVAILTDPSSADRVAAVLSRRDDRLPDPPRHVAEEPATLDIASVAIAGLEPVGDATAMFGPVARRDEWRWASATPR